MQEAGVKAPGNTSDLRWAFCTSTPGREAAQTRALPLSSRLGLLSGANLECEVCHLSACPRRSSPPPPAPQLMLLSSCSPVSSGTQPYFKKSRAMSSRHQTASLRVLPMSALPLPSLEEKGVRKLRLPLCLQWELSAPPRYVSGCVPSHPVPPLVSLTTAAPRGRPHEGQEPGH